MKFLALAASAALALTATTASANGYWQDGVYYSTTTKTYASPSYTQPSYTAPSYGTQIYTQPGYSYVQPTVKTSTYQVPAYTAPTYTAPRTVYAPAPSYIQPRYDATDRVRQRIQNQRSRIERAEARGDLRPREKARLRDGLREVRATFRDYRGNDGVIGQWEEAELMRKLDRNSRRIARLGNNDRTVRYDARPYRPYSR